MKVPKKIKKYCPHCKTHTENKVMTAKSGGPRGTLKHGQRRHQRRSGVHGYGSMPQPKVAQRAKISKRVLIMYQCEQCKKKHLKQHPIRSKKFAVV